MRTQAPPSLPRLGFLGAGWIGRHRLEAVLAAETGVVVAVADPSEEARRTALAAAPDAAGATSLDALLEHDLDGIVIATPSAGHAREAIRALEAGLAVFCQKPVGRTAAEAEAVVAAARGADRLLGVDMCYRRARAAEALKRLVEAGELGAPYALDLAFHNAYGPDKPWFYDVEQSGGGCVMDLGIHLVDLALWLLDFPEVEGVESALHAGGRLLGPDPGTVEDHATATLRLAGGAVARIACSWNLPAGREAVIGAQVYGPDGGAALRNVDGSFYDFVAERYRGPATEVLETPPDAWGGRPIVSWAERLARDPSFDPGVSDLVTVARVLDRIYGKGGGEAA
ncbi:MAG: Gfo/Idh/MocA family oxidoreductase [Gemmatimonadetes bacterium]|nr:Gfo/Idh/MocA family oxidoreductase [Gemmatimonadota bacterium]